MAAENKVWAVGELLATTMNFLKSKGAAAPRLDAELLLASVLKMPRVKLYVNFEKELAAEELSAYREMVRRRAALEPVAYILGEKEFYGLTLNVGPAVLIPRPETEHLVDAALRLAKDDEAPEIADIGCGSGAISLALAKNLPAAKIAAVDISPEALAVARANAENLGLAGRVDFYEGALLQPLAGRRFNYICANLPYIPSGEMATLMPDVGRHEPHLALDGGPEGLSLIEDLLREAPSFLEPDGRVFLEIWPGSFASLETKAEVLGFGVEDLVRDLAGHARVTVLRMGAA